LAAAHQGIVERVAHKEAGVEKQCSYYIYRRRHTFVDSM
jgi:hypothetical protein